MIHVLANTKLHFSDNQFNVIDISENSLVDNLYKLEETDFNATQGLIIFAEAKTKGEYHQNYKGLELLKHILLHQEKQYYELPILIVCLADLNHVLKHSADNMMLLASNINTITLEDFSKLTNEEVLKIYFHQKFINKISHKEFSNYVLIDNNDDNATQHDEINALGAKRMLKEWHGQYSFTEEPLHFKKYFFKHNIKMSSLSAEDIHKFNKPRDLINKVLFIDDEAAKWMPTLNAVFGAGKVDVYPDFKEAKTKLNNIKKKLATQAKNFRDNKPKNSELFSIDLNTEPKTSKDQFRQLDLNPNDSVEFGCNQIWEYDLVILDLRDKKSSEYPGKTLLQELKRINPHTPVIIFSASKQPILIKELGLLGYNYYFEKGKQSVSDLMNLIFDLDIEKNRKLTNIWWKLIVIDRAVISSKHNGNFYNFRISQDRKIHYQSIKRDQQVSLRLILHNIKEVLPRIHDFNYKLLSSSNISETNVVEGLASLYPIFAASEIRFENLKSLRELSLGSHFENSTLIKKERAFRNLRNSIYHTNRKLDFKELNSINIIEEIENLLDWLINPMQLDEVEDFLKVLAKVYGIKYTK